MEFVLWKIVSGFTHRAKLVRRARRRLDSFVVRQEMLVRRATTAELCNGGVNT